MAPVLLGPPVIRGARPRPRTPTPRPRPPTPSSTSSTPASTTRLAPTPPRRGCRPAWRAPRTAPPPTRPPGTPAWTSSSRWSRAPRRTACGSSWRPRGRATRSRRSGSSRTSAACAARASPTATGSTPPSSGCTGATRARSPATSRPSRSSATSRTSPSCSTASSTAPTSARSPGPGPTPRRPPRSASRSWPTGDGAAPACSSRPRRRPCARPPSPTTCPPRGRPRARPRSPTTCPPRCRPRAPTLADYVSAALTSTRKTKSKRGRKAAAVAPVETDEPEQAMEVEQKPEAMEVDLDQMAPPQEAADQDAVPSPLKEEVAAAATKKVTKKVRKVAKLAVQSLEMYYGDRAYRFLFDCVADFFADLLASDLKQLAPGGKKRKIGLAAKWCPTPGSSFDRTTLLCEAIARRLFPRESSPDYAGLSEEHYSYQALHRLRREVLVPLRKVLELPEVYMSAQRWSELPYTRVASVAMRRYKALFKKHDEERFGKYLEDVAAGKAKIAAGALLPHEIAAAAMRGEKDDVSELQWRRMVDDLRNKGSLSNCIAVCDVSGSMSGTPMDVCVALGLLISELSEKPWAGRVITFSHRPEIHTIKGKTLQEKLWFVQRMDWGGNTNFQAVFDRILRTAVDARLPREKMIRTVFVFSDMEFDQASMHRGGWETDYEAICRKFRDAGYGDVVPQIVFWNLRDSRSTPVTSTQPGVAMVSGFSKNFVKLFLENDGVVNPEAVMNAAIAGEEYQKLAVFD